MNKKYENPKKTQELVNLVLIFNANNRIQRKFVFYICSVYRMYMIEAGNILQTYLQNSVEILNNRSWRQTNFCNTEGYSLYLYDC